MTLEKWDKNLVADIQSAVHIRSFSEEEQGMA